MAEINPADCIPRDKFDEAAVKKAESLGFPGLNAVLPALLEWLQDPNWPVAMPLARVLAKAGPEIAPHLIAILRSDDGGWKWSIFLILISELDDAVWALIKNEVERLAGAPTADDKSEEIDELAAELLTKRSACCR